MAIPLSSVVRHVAELAARISRKRLDDEKPANYVCFQPDITLPLHDLLHALDAYDRDRSHAAVEAIPHLKIAHERLCDVLWRARYNPKAVEEWVGRALAEVAAIAIKGVSDLCNAKCMREYLENAGVVPGDGQTTNPDARASTVLAIELDTEGGDDEEAEEEDDGKSISVIEWVEMGRRPSRDYATLTEEDHAKIEEIRATRAVKKNNRAKKLAYNERKKARDAQAARDEQDQQARAS